MEGGEKKKGKKEEREFTYNITFRCTGANTAAVESSQYSHSLIYVRVVFHRTLCKSNFHRSEFPLNLTKFNLFTSDAGKTTKV
jgi:hypothetical protein